MHTLLILTVSMALNAQIKAYPTVNNEVLNKMSQKFLIPTTIKLKNSISIHGTINNKDSSFTVVLPNAAPNVEDCTILYHFAKKTVMVMPPPDPIFTPAKLNIVKNEDIEYKFKLVLRAISSESEVNLNVYFNVNDQDVPEPMLCQIGNLSNMQSIIMKEGVQSVSRLSFDFD